MTAALNRLPQRPRRRMSTTALLPDGSSVFWRASRAPGGKEEVSAGDQVPRQGRQLLVQNQPGTLPMRTLLRPAAQIRVAIFVDQPMAGMRSSPGL